MERLPTCLPPPAHLPPPPALQPSRCAARACPSSRLGTPLPPSARSTSEGRVGGRVARPRLAGCRYELCWCCPLRSTFSSAHSLLGPKPSVLHHLLTTSPPAPPLFPALGTASSRCLWGTAWAPSSTPGRMWRTTGGRGRRRLDAFHAVDGPAIAADVHPQQQRQACTAFAPFFPPTHLPTHPPSLPPLLCCPAGTTSRA